MKISKIAVHGLFSRFNHEIALDPCERITIIFGPNGFGKTTILRLLDVLFNRSLRSLGRMPFEKLHVTFEDESILTVVRNSDKSSPIFSYDTPTKTEDSFEPEPLSRAHDVTFPLSAIEDFVPRLERISTREWRNIHTSEVLDLDNVIATYADLLPFDVEMPEERYPPWLKKIRTSLSVRLIDTERLTDFSTDQRSIRNRSSYPRVRSSYPRVTAERTVRRYSELLESKVQQTLTEYATLSQSLDRSFPARLVEELGRESPSIDQLIKDLELVEKRRSEIVEAGLLPQEHESLRDPVFNAVDESTRSVLAVYAQDATKKLNAFENLYARANAFVRIANSRLLYKKVSVSPKGFKVSNSDGTDLELEMLSSGEQHEIVLLFDLLFGTEEDSLIMVDEPELSLHVAWQRKMLKDLQELAELSDFRALLATHSPQIIGDRWDLTIELQSPEVK